MSARGDSALPVEGTLHVAQCWDGKPALPEETLSIEWRLEPSHLYVSVDAPYHGDPAPPGAPGRAERLWQFEVAELFLVGPHENYFELELGPHGHYLALRLEGVRHVVRDDRPVDYSVSLSDHRWRGRACVSRSELAEPIERINAFAIHGIGRERRHLAAYPLGGTEPDFHRIHAFPFLRDRR